jgi:hypothetical protein
VLDESLGITADESLGITASRRSSTASKATLTLALAQRQMADYLNKR